MAEKKDEGTKALQALIDSMDETARALFDEHNDVSETGELSEGDKAVLAGVLRDRQG